jgi:chromosomal replication initiator protein
MAARPVFHVPTTFFGSWVSQNYGDVIRRTLASAGVGADRVEFNVGPAEARHAGRKRCRLGPG